MTEGEYDDICEELERELYESIAKQLIADSKQDSERDWNLSLAFSKMAIEHETETLGSSNIDVAVCALCRHNTARRV